MTKMNFIALDIERVMGVTQSAVLVELDQSVQKWIPLSVLDYKSCKAIENGESPEQIRVHDWWYQKEVER